MTIRGKRYYRSSCIGRPGERRVRDHLFNRLNARDRLLREREPESNRSEQLAVNIYGAPAHPLNDSGFLQRASTQPSQNDALLWAEILEYSEDFDLKVFDAIVMEDSAAHAAHSWLHVLESEEVQ